MADISSIILPGGGTYDLKDKNAIHTSDKGVVNGVASLDSTGKVPSSQLPPISSVDPETIAPVEETATATVVHPLGSIFYLNDILYRAIADIPVGGTINTATGGNATQTSIAQNFKRTVTLTSAEYAQLSIAEKTADIVYIITDDNSIRANDVNYDHETSGASATNVQDALDEVFSDLDGKQPTITENGILKGDGTGGVTAATSGTDFQAPLTFDATPTANSTNPVQSGGVYTDVRTRVPVYGKGVNLLRNWYFANPVNQRGITSRAAAYSSQYFIDGWSTNRASFSIVSDGITFNAITAGWGFFQVIHSLVNGEKYTISVLSSGNLYSTTFTASSSNIGIDLNETFRVEITYYSNVWFNLKEKNVDSTIVAVKLELGAEQTLCHNEGTDANPVWVLNEIPDYEEELIKCQTSTADPADIYANKVISTNVSKPNFLRNWYFVGGGSQQGSGQLPINQRGQTSYQTADAYGIDGWRMLQWNTTARAITVNSGNVELTGSASGACSLLIWQNIENGVKLAGKTITVSVLCGASATGRLFVRGDMYGDMYGHVSLVPSGLTKYTLTLPDSITGVSIAIGQNGSYSGSGNTDIQILAVKLELGTEQTLAHQENGVWVLNEIPDYEYELIRCKTSTADPTDIYANKVISTNISNPNLLRNWYFVGGGTGRGVFPVNQRGRKSYTASSSAKFGPDAWKVYYGSILSLTAVGAKLSNGGVVVTDLQRNDSLWGRKVTLSVLTSGGIYKASGTMPSSAPASQTNVLIISNSALQFEYRIYANSGITSIAWRSYDSSLTYYAMKLEVGTEQTLCHNEGTAENPVWVLNEIPDYEYELYRCITSTADPSDTYANKSLATEQQLAYVESGTTASRNYTAGQYISLNGLLYTADTAIASGATFYTSGGNKNLTECVGGGFNSLSKVTNDNVTFSNNVTGYTYSNEYHLSKSGNVVTTSIYMSASSIAGMGTVLCTVPAAFRPSVNRRIAAWLTYNGESKVETVFISPSGEITTASGGSTVTGWIRVFGTYIL